MSEFQETTPAGDNPSSSASSKFDPNKSYDQARTILVSDLSQSSTKEMLIAHFLRFGKVTRCAIKVKMPSTKIGVVEFATVRDVRTLTLAEKTLEHFPHIIDGREVFLGIKSAEGLMRDYKLSIEGLSDKTSTKDLRQYFSQFGDIFACHIMRNDQNLSLGNGFVVFRSQEAIESVLNSPSPHLIGNDKIKVQHKLRPKDKKPSKSHFVSESGYSHLVDTKRKYNRSRMVMVSDLSNVTTRESLYEYLSRFGTLTGCKHFDNRTTMVEFSTNAETEKAAQFFPHIIDGREVIVLNERTYHLKKKYEICVKGLSETTSSNDLRQYFSKFGELVRCYVPMREDNTSRRTGYVTFNSQEVVDQVLNSQDPHFIDGKKITLMAGDYMDRLIFVAALSKYTTEDTLFNYFRDFGDIISCKLEKNQDTGLSRQIAEVVFATIEQKQKALNCDSHIIDGKKISVLGSNTKRYEESRLFVGAVPKTTSDKTFHQYFSQFGKIIESHIVLSESNSSRGFGYVTFSSQDSVDRVFDSVPHYIDGQPVNVELDIESGRGTFSSQEEVERALNDQPHFIEGVRVVPSRNKDKLELFIRYLSPDTSESSLESYFARYGYVRKIKLIRDEIDTRAIVSFYTIEDTLKAVNDRPHLINNKLVLSFQKDQDYTLFVDDLPSNVTEDSMRRVFSQFGKLVHWEIRLDRETGKSYGQGYVTFSTMEEAASAVKSPPVMGGKTLKVMLAIKDNLETQLFLDYFKYLES
ncbi:RNA recognition motif domain-containing protein [Ditylenchus destructor]|nr:RNA recognition motif domain-containing protein [Ditylenchus destructor]